MSETRRTLVRLSVLAAILLALLAVAHLTGFSARFSRAGVRALVEQSGAWGVALFALLFAAGALLYVPGVLFVAVSVLMWGRLQGGLVSYAGALLAALLSFALVRFVGGRPFAEVRNPRVRAVLARLEERPVLGVALLRTFFMAAPLVNYALALSPVGAGSYLVGTAIGLVPSIAVTTAFFGIFF
jgi:uncharacterized membrane protein YdjX (TVP38/TMEM64 family)